MNTHNNVIPEREAEAGKQSAETGEPVQISLPKTDDTQIGPFEHSGETSRQTEEAREEEKAQQGE